MSTHTPTVLERILAQTRQEVARRRREVPIATIDRAGRPRGRFRDALRGPGIGVIAEFKRRSPSAGELRVRPRLEDIVGAYARGGAAAVSVLTEGPNFDGSLDDLRAADRACDLPLLRKDFIVDEYQLRESHQAGADAVLLIVAALAQAELELLHSAAQTLGLDVLVEVHDREELDRALAVGADLIGVNNRDLRDFSVDMQRTLSLMDAIPAHATVVSESGIATPHQLHELDVRGVAAVLVGGALMSADDPEAALRGLIDPQPNRG